MQKRLEFKCASKTKSYINGSSEHWRMRGRRRCGTTICQHISNTKGCRGWRRIWSGSATIHKSAYVNKSATKCNGDWYECTKFYRGEKTRNHHGHIHTFGQRYSHFESWTIYVDTDETKLSSQTCPLQGLVLLQHFINVFKVNY